MIVSRKYDFTKTGLGEAVLDAKGRPILDSKGQYQMRSELYNISSLCDFFNPFDHLLNLCLRRNLGHCRLAGWHLSRWTRQLCRLSQLPRLEFTVVESIYTDKCAFPNHDISTERQ